MSRPPRGLAAVALLSLVSATPVLGAMGSPDCFGYTWTDNASGCTGGLPAFGAGAQSFVSVTAPMRFPLGFQMPWYGRPVTEVWVAAEGYVTFSDQGAGVDTNQSFPDPAAPNDVFAAFWITTAEADITVEATPGYFHVRWLQLPNPAIPTLRTDIHLLIFPDGSFRIHTVNPVSTLDSIVGHENQAATCGRTLYDRGTPDEGAFPIPGAGSAACVQAPVLLDCGAATVATCGDSVPTTLPAANPAPASLYNCSPDLYSGNEQVFRVDVPTLQAVTVSVDNPGLDLLHVGDAPCGENNCLGVADQQIDFPLLFPGSYWFVVDKMPAGGGDAFSFTVTCTDPFRAITCGESLAGDTSGLASSIDVHACVPAVLDGGESLFRVTLPMQETLIATLDTLEPDLWVVIYDAVLFDLDGSGCLAAGRGGAGAFDLPAGDYVVVVDGEGGANAPFTLDLACGRQLDCAAATDVSCTETVSGDTSVGSPSNVAVYSCSIDVLKGAEDVYRFFNPTEQPINARFLSSQPGQQLLLIPACDEGECLLSGGSGVSCAIFPPGEYFIVVDGPEGAEGAYDFEIVCGDFLVGTDLRVSAIDTTALTGSCQDFDVSGTAEVAITNFGTQPATAPFDVVVFEDQDLDGQLDDPGDNILGRTTIATDLGVGETLFVDVPASGTVLFRDNVIHAMVDPDDDVPEVNEDDNLLDTGRACEFRPPVGEFSPIIEWEWNSSAVEPAYTHVDTAPLVADMNGDTVPDVVFAAGVNAGGFGDGVVRVLDGATGGEIWTAAGVDARVYASSNLALADIDGDLRPEVVGHSNVDTNRLVAIDDDGSVLWQSEPFVDHPPLQNGGGGASIADLNCDGLPEIVWGANVFNADGTLFWTPEAGGTRGINVDGFDGAISVVADIDLDGQLEVVAGPTAYKWNGVFGAGSMGVIVWRNALVPDGFPAVGNFDSDPEPEIAITASGSMYVLNGDDGSLLWERRIPCGGGGCGCGGFGCDCNAIEGGPPTVADFDGDCSAEVGVAGADWYTVFETDGTVKWQSPINDCSSRRTASSVFDFEGDGAAEVAFMDQDTLHVFRGGDGMEIANLPSASHTWTEMITIADVDADNNAEIVMPLNSGGGLDGIQVIGDADDNWVNTRRIWNQHAYHINNINDDGTVPGPFTNGACEQPSWLEHNTYRDQLGSAVFTAADITMSIVETELLLDDNCFRSVRIRARVGNGGGINVGRRFTAWLYDGPPPTTPLDSVDIDDLQPGEYTDFEVIVPLRFGTVEIHGLADDDGTGNGTVNECREDNNLCIVTVENPPLPIDPPPPVGPALRVRDHGDPLAPDVTAWLDWTLDFGAPRTLGPARDEQHFHVMRGTEPDGLVIVFGTEPWLTPTYEDSTTRRVDGLPTVHYYEVIAADGCEQLER